MSVWFIAGTDTGVGKTVVAAALTKRLGAAYWKPIQTGDDSDTTTVAEFVGVAEGDFPRPAYQLQAPLSPHLAARREGITIDPQRIERQLEELLSQKQNLVIEGAGGLCVPLAPGLLQIDLLVRWRLPVVLVAHDRLGAINHTLLSLFACRRAGLDVKAVILNQSTENFGNAESIREYGEVANVLTIPLENSPEIVVEQAQISDLSIFI